MSVLHVTDSILEQFETWYTEVHLKTRHSQEVTRHIHQFFEHVTSTLQNYVQLTIMLPTQDDAHLVHYLKDILVHKHKTTHNPATSSSETNAPYVNPFAACTKCATLNAESPIANDLTRTFDSTETLVPQSQSTNKSYPTSSTKDACTCASNHLNAFDTVPFKNLSISGQLFASECLTTIADLLCLNTSAHTETLLTAFANNLHAPFTSLRSALAHLPPIATNARPTNLFGQPLSPMSVQVKTVNNSIVSSLSAITSHDQCSQSTPSIKRNVLLDNAYAHLNDSTSLSTKEKSLPTSASSETLSHYTPPIITATSSSNHVTDTTMQSTIVHTYETRSKTKRNAVCASTTVPSISVNTSNLAATPLCKVPTHPISPHVRILVFIIEATITQYRTVMMDLLRHVDLQLKTLYTLIHTYRIQIATLTRRRTYYSELMARLYTMQTRTNMRTERAAPYTRASVAIDHPIFNRVHAASNDQYYERLNIKRAECDQLLRELKPVGYDAVQHAWFHFDIHDHVMTVIECMHAYLNTNASTEPIMSTMMSGMHVNGTTDTFCKVSETDTENAMRVRKQTLISQLCDAMTRMAQIDGLLEVYMHRHLPRAMTTTSTSAFTTS